MMVWALLTLAIISEVVATSALKAADGFTRLGPSVVVVVGYAAAFYCLSLTLRLMPVGIAYAIWAGLGTCLIALIGALWYKQRLDIPGIVGIALILAGVIVLNVFSKSSVH